MNKEDYISPIKEILDDKMHMMCAAFVLIGTSEESPRWFNFKEFDEDTKVLTIGSTQRNQLYFNIQTDYNIIDVTVFWKQFKAYRTEFLENNYPTISRL